MTNMLVLVQFIFTIIMGLYFFNALKGQQTNKIVIDKESRKEMDNLKKLRNIKLSEPLTERSRPTSFDEVIGQEKGIKALQAALCGPNPQHVIIYGPPGVGKTAAARLVLQDAKIKEYKEFRRVRVKTINSEDKWMNLNVDCGNYAGKELKYLVGTAPSMENEIAFSKLNSDEMGKDIGDKIILAFNGIQKKFVISGIYQDVTSRGYTAKAIYSFAGVDAEKYQFTINLTDGVDAGEKASQWSDKIGGGYDIEPMEEFINQTLGGVSSQIKISIIAVVVIGILLAALIVVLFMKLRLAKDVAQIAAMKAIGFTNSDVRKQYLYKTLMVSIAGIFTGAFISNILGESIVSVALSITKLGISRITFIKNPWIVFVILPLVLLAVVAGMTWISTRQIREYNIISLINE
ncbi:FtsX-like permease family protein [Clostridium beijerinckii]|nr:FtsX-like permease family protein [Clostridium beijerinckii]